jgi:hypothetical protein
MGALASQVSSSSCSHARSSASGRSGLCSPPSRRAWQGGRRTGDATWRSVPCMRRCHALGWRGKAMRHHRFVLCRAWSPATDELLSRTRHRRQWALHCPSCGSASFPARTTRSSFWVRCPCACCPHACSAAIPPSPRGPRHGGGVAGGNAASSQRPTSAHVLFVRVRMCACACARVCAPHDSLSVTLLVNNPVACLSTGLDNAGKTTTLCEHPSEPQIPRSRLPSRAKLTQTLSLSLTLVQTSYIWGRWW